MNAFAPWICSLIVMFAVTGCTPDRDLTGFDGGTGCENTTAADLDELFDEYFDDSVPTGCSTSGCHGTGAGDLTFRTARELWAATVNRKSRSFPDMNLVTPGDLSNSYLYWKLHPTAVRPMPEGGPFLDDVALARVAGWICAGAPNAAPTDGGVELPDAGVDGPTLTAFAPASGVVGTPVTIEGTGFSTLPDENTVAFNGTPALVETATETTLTTSVPQGASTGPITVDVDGLTGISEIDFQVVVPNPMPELSGVTPSVLTAGGGDVSLTLEGAAFVSTSAAQWDGTALDTTFDSESTLSALVPGALLAIAGEHSVTVTNPGPGGGTSAAFTVAVRNPVPTVTSFTPAVALAGGAPLELRIEGTGFVGASTVTLNGATAASAVIDATALTTQVPAALLSTAGSVAVVVTNPAPGGGSSASVPLPVHNPAPAIDAVTPDSATTGAGDVSIVVDGSGFVQASVLQLDGAALPTVYESGTRLRTQVSAAVTATSGEHSLTVTNPSPGGGTSVASVWSVLNAVPTITSLSPVSVAANGAPFELTVTGAGFVSDSRLQVDGSPVPTRFVDATVIVGDVGTFTTAGSHPVTVVNPAPGGGTSAVVNLAVVTSTAPTITGLNPSTVIAGAAFSLTITGSGYECSGARASTVTVDRTTYTPTVCSTTAMTVELPALPAGRYDVQVKSGPGQSSNVAVLSVVEPNPAPTLSTLSPALAAAGSAGFVLTATGSDFVPGAVLSVDGSPRSTTFVSGTELTAAVLASDVASVGTRAITVTNPAPGGGDSGAVSLPVVQPNPTPAISGLNPGSVVAGEGATVVELSGTGFLSSSQASFDGSARPTTFVSSTRLSMALTHDDTSGPGAHAVVVTNPAPGGGASNGFSFTVVAPNPLPSITSLSPVSASTGGGGFTMTVDGTGFVPSSTVLFDGAALPTTFVSTTRLQAALAAAVIASAGEFPIQVRSPAPGGGTSELVLFPVINPAPSLGSISPSTVTVGSTGFALTLFGDGFVSDAQVRVDGSDRTTRYVNSTQLSADLAASDVSTTGTRAISVFNPAPGGGTSNDVTLSVASEPNPRPVVSTLSPCGGVANTGAFTLTITGTGFVSATTALFNGAAVPVTFVSDTELTAAIPNIATAPADNAASLIVSNPSPGGGAAEVVHFGVATKVATLSAHVQPIFDLNCSTSQCHAGRAPSGDLDLTAGVAHANLVGAPSADCSNRSLVLACGPLTTQSHLIAKILGVDMCSGSRMPKSRPLSSADQQVLIDWVAQGAPQ